jgi:hypothetical protein
MSRSPDSGWDKPPSIKPRSAHGNIKVAAAANTKNNKAKAMRAR